METRNIPFLLEEKCKTHGDQIFVGFKEVGKTLGEEVTFAEMDWLTNQIAHGFMQQEVKKGDRVCMILPNCLEFMYCWFALLKIGAVTVPLNYEFKGIGLANMINSAEARILVIDSKYLEAIKNIQDDLNFLKVLFIRGGMDQGAAKNESMLQNLSFTVHPYASLISQEMTPIKQDVRFNDLAMLLFTSGTTGPSKGVMITHNFAIHVAEGIIQYYELNGDDVLYCPFPLFHVDAALLTVLPGLKLGAKIALSDRFSASKFWDEVRYHGATIFDFMGATLNMLYNQPPRHDDGDNPVRLAWGVPVPETWSRFEERFKLKIATLYGLTDAGIPVYHPLNKQLEPGLCGLPTENYDVRIFDSNDFELPPDEVGEIVIRHKQPYTIMEGYYNRPEDTIRAFKNLWFHTGDLGYKDKQGYLYFAGRSKDSIRRRGENISAWEIESVIDSHPLVMESAAIGVPSVLTEEDVKVYVVLKQDADLTPTELADYCKKQLARFMVPRYIEFVDALPKTPTDKVEKYKLKEIGVNKNTWDMEAHEKSK